MQCDGTIGLSAMGPPLVYICASNTITLKMLNLLLFIRIILTNLMFHSMMMELKCNNIKPTSPYLSKLTLKCSLSKSLITIFFFFHM